MYVHTLLFSLSQPIAAACKVAEVRNLICTINEAHLFLSNSSKRQRYFELTVKAYLPETSRAV